MPKKKCYICNSSIYELRLRREIQYKFLGITYRKVKTYICLVCDNKKDYYKALGK